jgi:hypothetical protein
MDIKSKTCDIRTWRKHLLLSTNIGTRIPSIYQCVGTRRIEVFWLLSQPLLHLRCNLFVIRAKLLTRFSTHLWATLRNKQETFIYEYRLHYALSPTPTKKNPQNRTLLGGSTLLKHGHHFDYRNQPLNMRMRVYYLDCYEAGLCCYLVIHKSYYVNYGCFTSIYDLFTHSIL